MQLVQFHDLQPLGEALQLPSMEVLGAAPRLVEQRFHGARGDLANVGGRLDRAASPSSLELGGAGVTWTFTFEKTPDGSWKVTSHDR
jgi:hypothetical protein